MRADPGRLAAGVYGDDFTGATDAVAQFRRWGLSAVLLVEPPSAQRLRELSSVYDVVGVAGIARSLPTARMHEEIAPVFAAFAEAEPRIVQYKVCSTIDSSATIGSFGEALSLGAQAFGSRPAWIAPAQPDSGRWTAFGNHFANADGRPYRLDRHPIMSVHPSTPMGEADVGRLLAGQGYPDTGLVSIVDLHGPAVRGRIDDVLATGARGVIFDALTMDDLVEVGELILERADEPCAFVLGSGGISFGLAARLGSETSVVPDSLGELDELPAMLVVSGSAAAPTARQIDAAVAAGWSALALDLSRPLADQVARVGEKVRGALASGTSMVVYSARGPGDVHGPFDPKALGAFYAELLADVVPEVGLRRLVVAGGDTSGYVVRELGVRELEILGRAAPGGPVCRVISAGSPDLVGLELMLKGGQIGAPELFEAVRRAGR